MAFAAMSMMGTRFHRFALVAGIFLLLFFIFVADPQIDFSDEVFVNVKNPGSRKILETILNKEVAIDESDQSLNVHERQCLKFELGGFNFDESGKSEHTLNDVVSCMAHSFSPYIEKEAAKSFVDPARTNIYFANSPATMWYKGNLVLVSRIWLDREKYEKKDNWPANHFADNYLYTQKFDRNMRPVTNGSIIGIPSPKQWWVGDGPIEPRLFKFKNKLYITFNAAMAFSVSKYIDFTVIWDYEDNKVIVPEIKGGSPMINATEGDDMPRDKHWMALVDKDELYFVHNIDPLRILKCSITGYCYFIHNEKDSSGFIFNDHVSHLRGGTPFELYEWPYYVMFAHSTLYKETNHHRFYTAHLVVLCVDPYRIVYVSDDIKIHKDIYAETPMVRPAYIDEGFIFPVGLILEDKDTFLLGVHVNDFSSVLIRIKGMERLMKRVIELDKRSSPHHGPPIGSLQRHIHENMEKLTNKLFVHV